RGSAGALRALAGRGPFSVGAVPWSADRAYLAVDFGRSLLLSCLAIAESVPRRPLAAAAIANRSAQYRRNLGRHHCAGHPPASAQAVPQAAPGAAVSRATARP